MTASVNELGKGRDAGSYYTSDPDREARPHRRDEYYLGSNGQEQTAGSGAGGGIWWSTGETIVAHGTPVDGEVFRDLCAGLDPRTGDRPGTAKGLVRGAGDGHRAGWDITFSAPKTVSLLWAAGNEEQRAAIRAAHSQAVEAALAFVKSEGLLVVRLGAGGVRREQPTDLMIARFDHFTSREGDPNLHSHCVIMNVAGSADGKHRTLEPRVLYDWQKTVGSAYRMHLSVHLHQQGMKAREAGRGQFEVAGIDQLLIDRFSKRSAQIEEIVGDRADATGRQKEIANLSSRKGKDQVPTGEALEARWLKEFGSERDQIWTHAIPFDQTHRLSTGLHHDVDLAAVEDFPTIPEVEGQGPVAKGASALLRHEIVIDRRNVLERSFALASLEGIGATAVATELAALEANLGLLRLTADARRNAAWTTPELKRLEADMLKAARRPDERIWLEADAIEAALQNAPHLSEEQIEAVRTAGSQNGVDLLQAGAGTGKTTTMQPIVRAAELSGLRVIGLAPSWVAADELRKSTGIPAVAIAKWRYDYERGQALPIDSRTVLMVDEASMVGTRDMAAILTVARDAGAKVLLVGDKRQLEAVGPGAPLRIVAAVLEQEATLLQVRRQQVAWQCDASIAMARGDVATGVQAYLDHGAAEAADGREATLARSVETWSELRSRHGDDTLMITRRNKDVADLNRKARAVLRSQERLIGEEVALSSVDREGKVIALSVAIGDRLRFGQSHPTLGLRNGTLLVVENVRPTLNDVVVRFRTPDGSQIETAWQDLAPSYKGRVRPPRVTHAYASTIHGAQGRTVSASVYMAIMEPDARELYVALTRHAQDAKIVMAKALEGGALSIQRHQDTEMGIAQSPEPATRWKANIIDFE